MGNGRLDIKNDIIYAEKLLEKSKNLEVRIALTKLIILLEAWKKKK